MEQAENAALVSLAELEQGADAEIVRLAEHDGDLLHWFYEQGLVPGTQVEMRGAQPAAGQLTVAVEGAERALSEKAADGIYVRAA
jgi:Fe2+ transport system protein FeoA